MGLMSLIYLLSGLAFDSLVIMFAFLFGAIPGGWYKRKILQLQLFLSSFSFFTGALSCIFAKINEEYLLEINTLHKFSFLRTWQVLYAIAFFGTLYKLKKIGGLSTECIRLKNTEYQISNKLEYTLGDSIIYMPNVKSCAIAKNCTILFSGARPEKEIDAEFICKKIDDKVYECLSYIDLNEKFSIKRIINSGINCLIVFVFMLIPLIVQYMDITAMTTGPTTPEDDPLYNLFGSVVTFLLGALFCKLFKNIKEVVGKILYWLGVVMVILSFPDLIIGFFS